jgi:hypothetical protein
MRKRARVMGGRSCQVRTTTHPSRPINNIVLIIYFSSRRVFLHRARRGFTCEDSEANVYRLFYIIIIIIIVINV